MLYEVITGRLGELPDLERRRHDAGLDRFDLAFELGSRISVDFYLHLGPWPDLADLGLFDVP